MYTQERREERELPIAIIISRYEDEGHGHVDDDDDDVEEEEEDEEDEANCAEYLCSSPLAVRPVAVRTDVSSYPQANNRSTMSKCPKEEEEE